MNFCWSTLQVADMEESLTFYQEILGLPLQRRFLARPGVDIAFLGEGETKVELICDEANRKINIGGDISWGFTVNSVEKTMEEFKAKGIEIHSGPFQPNEHLKFFYIIDPNGLKIQLVENIRSMK
jgi:lactoylglutathione lyase